MNLIIGATGMLGSEICRLLTMNNEPVRALVRKTTEPTKIKNLEKLGVEIIKGDVRDDLTFEQMLKGINTIICTISSMPFAYIPGHNNIEKVDLEGMMQLIDHAKKAGVAHFVYTSFSGQIDLDFPLRNAKRTVEKHLQNSGMPYTILRPSYFMEVWLTEALGFEVMNERVKLYGDGTNPVSFISIKDVAKFAVESISNLNAKNAIIELGGPEKLSQLEAVEIFEEISDQKFETQFFTKKEIQTEFKMALDPMQKSFFGLMLCYAHGDPIEMENILMDFPLRLLSVKEYAQNMVALI